MNWSVTINNKERKITLPNSIPHNVEFGATLDGNAVTLRWHRYNHTLALIENGVEANYRLRRLDQSKFKEDAFTSIHYEYWRSDRGERYGEAKVEMAVAGAEHRAKAKSDAGQTIRSQITGKILDVMVEKGKEVAKGDTLLIIEAMKMENRIFATKPGTVSSVKAKTGASVTVGEELLRIE
jgi:biotin carboxyl carrier protein